MINKKDVKNIAGLKINQAGYGLAVLLIEAPPSKYGKVLWITSPWFGKSSWNCVINNKQVFTAKKGTINIQMLMDLTLLISSMKAISSCFSF